MLHLRARQNAEINLVYRKSTSFKWLSNLFWPTLFVSLYVSLEAFLVVIVVYPISLAIIFYFAAKDITKTDVDREVTAAYERMSPWKKALRTKKISPWWILGYLGIIAAAMLFMLLFQVLFK